MLYKIYTCNYTGGETDFGVLMLETIMSTKTLTFGLTLLLGNRWLIGLGGGESISE